MAQPYVGEIRLFAGNFAPAGWMFCEGELLPIDQYTTLFQLIGTSYGGDGQSTFALPDLRGRVPVHVGNGLQFAQNGGVETVTLNVNATAPHTHVLLASSDAANSTLAQGNLPATPLNTAMYYSTPPSTALAPAAIGVTGGNQPHQNMQPYACLSFIISLFGIFPSQT